ncbi:protein TIFY 11d-like [Silene latifolia]|uniref:protein TIFY 11d-like n=1 Tax=Silene latifolia TaxID=37657 RepID=UPI003D775848
MSNSISINEFSRFAAGKNMNFSQTCNLLSQFVKDNKRPTGDRSTMNLFPVNQAEDSNGSIGRTINLFPQISGFDSSVNKRPNPEPAAAQMTIFYGGQVVVFNDLPSDKAAEVINLASSFESSLKKRKVETCASPVPIAIPTSVLAPNAKPSITQNQNPSQPQSQSLAMGGPNFMTGVLPPASPLPRASIPADLPITRKASLQRFLEKRKDRLVSKASPSENVSETGAAKAVEGKTWLGLNSLPVFQQKQQL